MYLNSQIQTRKKAFAKLLYLDDASVISIYPKSEIIIEGSVNEGVINKKIQVVRGVVWINSDSLAGTDINMVTASTELICNKCSFWK